MIEFDKVGQKADENLNNHSELNQLTVLETKPVECYCPEPFVKQGDSKCMICGGIRLNPVPVKLLTDKEAEEIEEPKIKFEKNKKGSVLEVIGQQKTLFGSTDINITSFANLKQKRELKEKVKSMFNGEIFRSILKPKELDNNIRLDKLERLGRDKSGSDAETTQKRAREFAKKTLATLSTFPSTLTLIYTSMLSKEGDKVFDPFTGHNSRGADVLSLGRKYYGYDIHSYPVDFTIDACSHFNKEDFEIVLGSSEKVKYDNESMDFALTCPPYWDVEDYSRIYGENKEQDLSNLSYEKFLCNYEKILVETYRVLKKGAYFVIVIGDVHRDGKYYQLSNDTDAICKKIGFRKHAEDIYNRGSNIGGDLNYKQYILLSKYLPVIHEYILVYQKQ